MLPFLELGEERFHFSLRVAVARLRRYGDALRKDGTRIFRARLFGQQLAQHLVARNITGIALEQFAKLPFRLARVAGVQVFQRQAISREGIVGLLGYKRFEHFTTRFFGVTHGVQVV